MSARMEGNDSGEAAPLDADHLQMCKFKDAKAKNIKRVLQTFEAVAIEIKSQQGLPLYSGTKKQKEEDDAATERLKERLADLKPSGQ